MTSISGGASATYGYNGLGDRVSTRLCQSTYQLSQNGVNYTLDLNSSLTQVLADGTNMYLPGPLDKELENRRFIIYTIEK